MTGANAWVQDFTYLKVGSNIYYLALVMELKTRRIIGWKLGTNHSSRLTHQALLEALSNYPKPSILHSDQGSEYLSELHQNTCNKFHITLSASAPGSPWQNGFMERFMHTLKQELGSLSQYRQPEDLFLAVAKQIAYYNNQRIHTALKMSPAQYAKKLKLQDTKLREMACLVKW